MNSKRTITVFMYKYQNLLAIILLALILIGCQKPSQQKASTTSSKLHTPVESHVNSNASAISKDRESATSPPSRPQYVSTNISTSADAELLNDDPTTTGWKSESIHSAIDKALKQLGDLISQSDLDRDSLSSVTDQSQQFAGMRPSQLVDVFSDQRLSVRRSSRPDSNRMSLADSIRTLRQTLNPDDPVDARSKFKTFAIELNEQTATTKNYFQWFAHQGDSATQVNATWKCDWAVDSSKPHMTSLEILDYEELVSTNPTVRFADCTEAVVDRVAFDQQFRMGVDHWLDRIESRMGIDIGGWQGLAIGDVNGDQLEDIYVCAPGGLPNRLLIQNGDGTTSDVSKASGVDWVDSSHAALLVDLDNDGDQDLVVGVSSGVILMSNDGLGNFTTRSTMVLPAALPYSLSAADYDADGDLDVFVCCYNRRSGINRHLLFARPVPYHDANNGGRNVLLQNSATPPKGEWRFQYATSTSGLDQNNRRFSYASAWEDYDNDGDLDLYVANDFGRNNLFRNDRGTFTDTAERAGVEDIGPGMSAVWGDVNNDGNIDLYVSNMFSSAGNRIATQSQFQSETDDQTRQAFQRHARGNSLFINQGDGMFEDKSVESGVVLGRWAWGSNFVDLNNDGWQDIVVANGFITQADTGDL